ncbi:2OG-Fe(II) oxygenase [Elongatibacter sediminis]|uniref:2OG-Fe(II) oxygenase n=1 Tax=Elongatibacter sediminis TaxID=3119006 RepID=A0AAW9RAZ7_9GAMM
MNASPVTRPLFRLQRTDPCFCGSGRRFKSCCGSLTEPRNPPHGVHVQRRFLDSETCAEWVRHLDSRPRSPLAVHALDDDEPAGLAKEKTHGRVTDKVDAGELQAAIVERVQEAFATAVPAGLDRRVDWFENPQVLRYEPGGLYGPHADSDHFMPAEGHWRKVIDRDVSILLYLNEDFEGGELMFRQFNYRYRPHTGDLLFFPSHGHYAHQALPVKHGVRYVVVSWAAFVDEPRVLTVRPSGSIDMER